jgi:P4 family phage/plasmid primase-like protien
MGVLKIMRAVATQPLRTSYLKGVNFANGYLTEKLELVPHAPEYGMTYTLPYRYTPEKAGHMPMFDQFLNDSWAEDPDYGDKMMALQEIMGVSLMGEAPRYQRAFLLFGQAGAGKSVMSAIMKGLLPSDSFCGISPSDWGDRFLPAQLHGKIVNFAGELSETRLIPGDIFKAVIGGEEMTVQYKNQNPFNLKPECAHWFNSNHLPKTRDTSEGFTRRWVILEWLRRVDPSKRIADLDAQILEHEREAIVAWAIQGYKRLMDQGDYTVPTSHLALVDQMAADNNSVRHFLTATGAGLKWDIKESITLVDLHKRYWEFSLLGGGTRLTLTKFAKLMKELAGSMPFEVEYRGPNEIVYLGIGV